MIRGTLIPRTTDRWRSLYRERIAVERGSASSNTCGRCCPWVRRLDRVQLQVHLTVLAPLGHALLKTGAVSVAAYVCLYGRSVGGTL